MHVFVTGATGWVGSAVVKDLVEAGHRVTGLARSAKKAVALIDAGATVVPATLDDLDILQATAATVDAVIHTAFNHDAFSQDFSKFAEAAEQDRRAIDALGCALQGSQRPLLVTSGFAGIARGGSESDLPPSTSARRSEAAAQTLAERGVRAATIRLAPSVHGIGDHGFIPTLIRMAREKGVSAYVGDGQNCWAGVHRQDAARVYRLAIEQGAPQPVYHAAADEAVPFKSIAEAIGRHLGLPVESRTRDHFGWFAYFAGGDLCASSARTRGVLDWQPSGPGLLADLDRPEYYAITRR